MELSNLFPYLWDLKTTQMITEIIFTRNNIKRSRVIRTETQEQVRSYIERVQTDSGFIVDEVFNLTEYYSGIPEDVIARRFKAK